MAINAALAHLLHTDAPPSCAGWSTTPLSSPPGSQRDPAAARSACAAACSMWVALGGANRVVLSHLP